MNSLTLIKTYNSSDSDTDGEEDTNDNRTKPERLPVPAVFEKTPSSKTVLQERNEYGKVRNFPHEPGIWATYIHLPIAPFPELLEYIDNLSMHLGALHLNLVDDFHVSLTKTVILKHHWIQDFTASVKKSLADVNSFIIYLSNLKVYVNEQKTRTFLSLKADDNSRTLNDLVSKLNMCLKEYNLQEFYNDPSFHLSLFWLPGDEFHKISTAIGELPEKLKNFTIETKITHCACTSGNKLFKFNFR